LTNQVLRFLQPSEQK